MGNLIYKKVSNEVCRTVYPCTSYPREMSNFEDPNKKFANNYVRTTKYKFWNFLLLNLWEQLHRFANCYFIFIVVLNFMPRIEAFGKELAVIPVAIVLGLTAVKDGFEDFKRFCADQVVNNMTANVFCV